MRDATTYAYTPNGARILICTITRLGLKLASCITRLRVEPQATQVMTPTKTPEELEQEAKDQGRLRTWHEFSWWYPWYRLHLVSVFNGEDVLDVGLAPLGCDVVVPYPIFDSWINDFISAILKAYAIGWITAEIAVLAAMQFGLVAFGATLLFSVATKGLILALNWDSVEGLKSVVIGAWVSLILGTVGTIKMLHSGLVSLAFGFLEAAGKVDLWKFIYKFVYIPINIALLLITINRLNELGGI